MAVTLDFDGLIIKFEDEKTPPFSFSLKEGDRAAIIFSRDFYDRAMLNFLSLITEDYKGVARFNGTNYRDFGVQEKEVWHKSFASVSLVFPMISNLKTIENIYLPIFYRENMAEETIFEKAYNIMTDFGIEKKFNVLPAFLSNFEKKLALFARAILSEAAIIYFGNVFYDMDAEKRRFFIEKVTNFNKKYPERIMVFTLRSENELKNVEEIGFNKIIRF